MHAARQDSDSTRSRIIEHLRRTLVVLASPAQQQIAHLHTLGNVSVDELGLEFDDVLPAVFTQRLLTAEQESRVNALDRQLQLMSGAHNEPLWTEDALVHSEHRATVRELAGAALNVLA